MPGEQLIRVTVCAKRNPKLSEDEFSEHWTHKHGPLITSWLQRHNCVKYIQVCCSCCPLFLSLALVAHSSQYHTTSAHRSRLTQNTLTYDGIADFWYKTFEDFEQAYEEDYYLNVVKKDEEFLFDMESLAVTAGVEQVIIEGGQVVSTTDS
jgi:hypothetical protein